MIKKYKVSDKVLIKEKYNDWIFYYDEKNTLFYEIGEKIINNDYTINRVIKDTSRNYVSIIEINNQKYILKEIRSEVIIPQRKIQTIFKDGEALTSLKNCTKVNKMGFENIAMPLMAIIKKNIVIQKSYLLLEYIDGTRISTVEDLNEIIELIKEINKYGRYHGDLNTSNFIKDKNGKIYILDTQMKRDIFFSFKRSYDYLTLKEDLLVKELKYEVDKNYNIDKLNIGYLIAAFIKGIKRTKIIKKFRNFKKKLRKKGWKI